MIKFESLKTPLIFFKQNISLFIEFAMRQKDIDPSDFNTYFVDVVNFQF
jgi:hypothetical protein